MNPLVCRARPTVLSIACALSCVPVVALAADLSETVVTASRNPQLLEATMPHTTVITREAIERSQATDLVSLLQREAGLQRTQNGGAGTTSSLFVRGAPSLQTLVLIDGVPQNKQDASGAVSLEHLMLDNVERVEIVRGNVSAIYGSGAVGGVIQIFTRSGAPGASITAEVGPRGTRKWAGQVSASSGDTRVSAGVSRFETDGFSAIRTAQFSGANPDADSYANVSGNLSVTHRLKPGHEFGLRVARSAGDSQYDSSDGVPTDLQWSTTRLNQITLFSDNTWGNWRSRVALSEQSDSGKFYDNGQYGSNNGFKTQAQVLNWVNTIALPNDWLLTAGVDRQVQDVVTSTTSSYGGAYQARRNTTALFAGMEGRWGPGQVQFNARHDTVGTLSKGTGYVGYSLPLMARLKAVGSVSTAFNAPPLGYLYSPGSGNPNLKPEQAHSHELGLQHDAAEHRWRATWFNTQVRDQLEFSAGKFVNIGKARNRGLELSYRGMLASAAVRVGVTLQNPINELTGQALTRRSRTAVTAGVSHAVMGVNLDADVRFSGQRADRYYDPATYTIAGTSLPAYAVLDMAASYPVRPGLDVKARLDNVTNKSYQTVYGYNQQPRSLYLGLKWSLQPTR
jgi:vitamin B12 transporter